MAMGFSAAVLVGVTLEIYFIVHAYREDREAWSRGIIRPPDKPSSWSVISRDIQCCLSHHWNSWRAWSWNTGIQFKWHIKKQKHRANESVTHPYFLLLHHKRPQRIPRSRDHILLPVQFIRNWAIGHRRRQL